MTRSIGNVQTSGSIPPTYKVYTAGSGTYTPPVGCSYLIVEAVGGGGGGGLAQDYNSHSGGGGGGGGYFKIRINPTSASYSVGAGGSGRTTQMTSGGNGGNTTFAGYIAGGGSGGNWDIDGTGGYGGTNTIVGALTILADVPGGYGSEANANNFSAMGGGTYYGPGTGTQNTAWYVDATTYGSGGAGMGYYINPGTGSGNGKSGIIVITEYY